MKRLPYTVGLLLFALLLFPVYLFPGIKGNIPAGIPHQDNEKIKWAADYDSAVGQAKKEKKLLYVFANPRWAGPGRWMEANVFTEKRLIDKLIKTYICFKTDPEHDTEFVAKFKIDAYPAHILINPATGKYIMSMGAKQTEDLLDWLKTTAAKKDLSWPEK